MGMKQAIKSLDAFPRAEEHLFQKTRFGAIVSILGLVIMATLFLHELKYYLATYTVHQMSVDLKRGETLPIHINMSFPSLPCEVLSVDAIDMSGNHEVDLDTNIWKLRLSKDGHIIGTEYLSDLVEKEHTNHKHGLKNTVPEGEGKAVGGLWGGRDHDCGFDEREGCGKKDGSEDELLLAFKFPGTHRSSANSVALLGIPLGSLKMPPYEFVELLQAVSRINVVSLHVFYCSEILCLDCFNLD
ncbi:hypothetical protein GIB67_023793 [Kingdonia uniflora]|uniref:Endoplasmic reticulum vesicle transporter N-terminal domain-containing protein n=1 Tax=Kingdonia uniflora TaxID=39325 RepID=A0A7J7NGA0_9MAGN|nr:hypothetical protein GIB67_023793 [Kingdonia uniflora]